MTMAVKKNTLVLSYIGKDDWGRPVYKDQEGKFFKDVNSAYGMMELCTAYGFDGEPDTLIENIKEYQGVEIEIIGDEEEPTPAEKFNYQMLSRLKMDCDYYLGNGHRNKKHLWAGNEEAQIAEMKKLYVGFEENKKPEWLTMDDILEYERKMLK